MDPFAAIGLAGNILTFLDFGCKLASKAKSISESASGASSYNEDLATMTQQFQSIVTSLKVHQPIGSMEKEQTALHLLTTECNSISVDLMKLLDELRAKKPSSKRESFRAAVRDWRKKEQKNELELKLDRCRQQLSLQITALTRSESLERLDSLISHGQASENELHSLIRNVESLRLGANVSSIEPEALNQIRSILTVTDEAIFSVRRNRFLDGLRFEQINERFEDVEEAHSKTLQWIFPLRPPSLVGDEIASYDHDDAVDINSDYDGSEGKSSVYDEEDKRTSVHTSGSSHKDRLSDLHNMHGSSNLPEQIFQVSESFLLPDEVSDAVSTMNLLPMLNVDSEDHSSFDWDGDEPPTVDDRFSDISDGEISFRSIPTSRHSSTRVPEIPEPVQEAMRGARETFITWLEEGDGIFHISGKPGSGKSTLMKFICEHPKTKLHLQVWAGHRELAIGKFFFWKPGTTLQKSLKGLIRGLLYCLLSNAPDLIPLAFPAQWEASIHRDKINIENQDCLQALETLISDRTISVKNKFVFFIDGLDEFEGNHLSLVRKLFVWAKNTGSVKLCVSSREWSLFQEEFKECPKFHLHELTHSDIQQFVSDRFQEMDLSALQTDSDSNTSKETILKNEVIARSDGVFLWVSLILRHIEDGLVNGDRMEDLMKVITYLPTELEQLLSSIIPGNRKLAYGILSFAFFCSRHYNTTQLMQYSFMDEYISSQYSAIESPVRLFTVGENIQRLARARKRIYGVCKGFLELRPHISGNRSRVREILSLLGDVVRFTHRSIVEFLGSQHFRQEMEKELPGFEPLDAYYQTYLLQIKHVPLPRFYFAASVWSQNRLNSPYYLDSLFENCGANKYVPLVWDILHMPPSPSFIGDLTSMIVLYLHLGSTWYSERFYKFLGAIHDVLLNLGLNNADAYIKIQRDVIPCQSNDLVTLLSAGLGFSDYIIHRQDISFTLISKCLSLCMTVLGPQFHRSSPSMFQTKDPIQMKRSIQTLAALFDQGASPDSKLSSSKSSAFHILLGRYCFSQPDLAVIAFMLYNGANPRFAIVLDQKLYHHHIVEEEPHPRIVSKAYFRTDCPAPDAKRGWEASRITMQRRLMILPTSSALIHVNTILPDYNSKDDIAHLTRLVVTHSPDTLDILARCGRIIDLMTLVSIWFPDQADVLQEVIGWILEQAGVLNEENRSQLRLKFGHLLQPFFDAKYPGFVGWNPPSTIWPGGDLRSIASESDSVGIRLYNWE